VNAAVSSLLVRAAYTMPTSQQSVVVTELARYIGDNSLPCVGKLLLVLAAATQIMSPGTSGTQAPAVHVSDQAIEQLVDILLVKLAREYRCIDCSVYCSSRQS
jgi:hypothetical protein